MMIDITKTYRTLCGYPVRIYATDGIGSFCVHGAYCEGGDWILSKWTEAGHREIGRTCPRDLIEIKPRIRREVWVNVYEDEVGGKYATKELADTNALSGRIACVKITIDCEHGEGLE